MIDVVSLLILDGLLTFVLGDPLRPRCYRRSRGELLIMHGSRFVAAEGASVGCTMRRSGIRVQSCRVNAGYSRGRGRFMAVGEIQWETVLPGPDASQDGAQVGARVSGTPAALAVRSHDRRDRTGRVPVAIKVALDCLARLYHFRAHDRGKPAFGGHFQQFDHMRVRVRPLLSSTS